jgi:ABC-type amino acid transport substrate-binding protein/nitrogen-specific signal transduction histidine kinase/CheY-like chemotaxis protein
VNRNSEADGFSVELLRASLKAMGKKVTFRTGSWSHVKSLLIDKSIEVLPLVGRTPEREEILDFTFPYLTMHGTIVVRKGAEANIRTLKDLNKKTVAVMSGDNAEEFLRRENTGAIINTTETFEKALSELSDGKHDAVVIQKLLALQLIRSHGFKNLRIAGPPLKKFVQSFCFAVSKGNYQLQSILNEGLSIVIADGTFNHLRAKWFGPIEAAQRSRIVIGGDSDYPPYEFLDKNGQPTGYNVDIIRAVAKSLGFEIEIRLSPWPQTLHRLSNDEIDMIQGMFYSMEREKIFDFSPPHSLINHVIVTRKSSPDLQNLEDLRSKSIFVMDQDIMHDLAKERGLENQLFIVGNQEIALKMLSEGKGDCALVARIPALYWMKKNSWNNLKITDQPVLNSEYCFAALHMNRTMINQFSEGLAALRQSGELRRIESKWFAPYEDKTPDFIVLLKYSLFMLIPALLLLAGSYLWNRALQRRINEKTLDLQNEVNHRIIVEERLRQSEKMQAIGQLAGGIAHDFNNQLSCIMGFAELMHEELDANSELAGFAQSILTSSRKAADLTAKLLAFARKGKFRSHSVNLHHSIKDVMELVSRSIDKRINIVCDLKAENPLTTGDPEQLKNGLLNLALNSSDAMPDGGKLTFCTRNIVIDNDFLLENSPDAPPGNYVLVEVTDTGTGISPEVLPRIFDPFFTTKEQGKGTGLGLAALYGTIKAHAAAITVSSDVGKGTTFRLYFPECEINQNSETAQSQVIESNTRSNTEAGDDDEAITADVTADAAENVTDLNKAASENSDEKFILLVDDEIKVCEMTARMLKRAGFNIRMCHNGQEGLEEFRKSGKNIDLVILDMVMPVLNGRDTYMELQKINPQVRVLLASGYSINDEVQELLDHGARDFIQKPFRKNDLIRKVSNILGK